MANEFNEEIYKKTARAENLEYVKCQNCGGNMVFDPDTEMLKCEHCGTVLDFAKSDGVQEIALTTAFNNAEKWKNTKVFRCQNCGASIVMNAQDVAKGCPYCGTPQIMSSEDLAGLKPNAVYPFKFDKEDARSHLLKWAKKRFFAPRAFKKRIDVENINGVYEPCFTFDSNTVSTYTGKVGKTHTRVVRRNGKDVTESYVEWRNIHGTYNKFYDDVTVSCGSKIDQKTINKLLPFDYSSIRIYAEKFLSGYTASAYSKDIKSSWVDAKKIIDADLRNSIIASYDCDQVAYLNVSTVHNNVTYKYILVPIYVVNYTYRGKLFNVYINGSTGKVTGKSPKSFWKIFFTVLLALGLAVLMGYLFYKFGYLTD